MGQINILIVDDHAVVRTGISAWIASEPDLVLSGEAADGEEAVAKALELEPDVILMDLLMPIMDGITFIRNLRAEANYKFTPMLMLTTESSGDKKAEGKAAGATGWIVKPFNPDQLLNTVKKVLG